ncbi:MAG: MFS transporter [Clostridia bacterium]|nr:MFS transporter [Clostridia bacterium]
MIAYYGASAVYQGYMGLFYGDIGLNRAQIGMVNASAAVSALLAQPLWGNIGDRVRDRRRLLCLIAVAAALVLPAALFKNALWYQLAAAAAFYAFFSALLPLGDAAVLTSDSKDIYGKIRLAGGIGYAVFSLIGGWIAGRAVSATVWMAAGLLAAAAFSALFLPGGTQKRPKGRLLPALKDKKLRALLMFMLPAQVAMGFYYSFFALHFMSLPGAGHFALGAANLIASVSEIPYLLFSDRFYRKFGAGKTMLAAAAALSLRFFMLGVGKNVWIALLSQLLNGCGYIAIGVSMAKYISEHLPDNAAGGQALISLMFYGAARLPGSLLGGFAAEKISIAAVFLVVSALCALGFACFFIYAARRRFRV